MTDGFVPTVEVELDDRDVKALASSVSQAARSRVDAQASSAWWLLVSVVLIGLIGLGFSVPFAWILAGAQALVLAISVRAARQPQSPPLLNGRYEARPEGLRRVSAIGETTIRWSAIDRTQQTSAHIVVSFAQTGWVIPFRCFDSTEARDAFVAAVVTGAR